MTNLARWFVVFLCAARVHTAHAQGVTCAPGSTAFPCGSQIDRVQIARAPAEFSIQARVAQAKIAIGKGIFETLTVRVREGATALCEERFVNVVVENGVLNLRIGKEMSCDLDQVVREHSNLSLEICPGGAQCLPPMAFGAVPSALKATVAARARKAHQAQVAAQAHYTAALDADPDVAETGRIRQGYFEAQGQRLQGGVAATLAWNPVRRPTARTLVVAARAPRTGELLPLGQAAVVAGGVRFTGSVDVRPVAGGAGIRVPNGDLASNGGAVFDATLSVANNVLGDGQVSSAASSSVGGNTTVHGAARAGSASVVAGPLSVGQNGAPTTSDRLTVTGLTLIQGEADLKGDVRAGSAMRTGSLRIPPAKALLAAGTTGGFQVSGGGKSITKGNVVIAQLVGGNLEIAPPGGRIARVRIRTGLAGPTATFQDAVTLPTDLSCPFGKVRDQVSKACVDVDECATGEAACGANANCSNSDPGYTCTCKPGYIGNGYICTQQ